MIYFVFPVSNLGFGIKEKYRIRLNDFRRVPKIRRVEFEVLNINRFLISFLNPKNIFFITGNFSWNYDIKLYKMWGQMKRTERWKLFICLVWIDERSKIFWSLSLFHHFTQILRVKIYSKFVIIFISIYLYWRLNLVLRL